MAFFVKDILMRTVADNGESITIYNKTGESTNTETDTVTQTYTEVSTKAIITFVGERQLRLTSKGYVPGLDIVVQISPENIIYLGSYFTWNSEKYIVDRFEQAFHQGYLKENILVCKRYLKNG